MVAVWYAIRIYEAILILRVLFSWIRPDPAHPVVAWIYRLTEPVLEPIRRILPVGGMGIDFSPLILFLLIELLKRVIFRAAFIF